MRPVFAGTSARSGYTSTRPRFSTCTPRRAAGAKNQVPKAVDAAFARATDAALTELRASIRGFEIIHGAVLEQEPFRQRTRLAEAERTRHRKVTKAALQSQRIASAKIAS
ncbi:hypothetical protein MB84_27955 (plasmid) [Pandoraea oxalativorans]|uniref:Uncharacterized protein n=1 Tax=Pandoraea oxalativorans TaxID=573737 RepID=A0A192B0U7_9BURK|nr:hypothetical protein MB84_27955 [Pandoraea oxalativorans]